MSADGWGLCPKCRDRKIAEVEELRAQVAEAYGTVPAEDYAFMHIALAKAEREVEDLDDDESFWTLREDYEFYWPDDDTVVAKYSGWCQTCGFGTEFKHRHGVG